MSRVVDQVLLQDLRSVDGSMRVTVTDLCDNQIPLGGNATLILYKISPRKRRRLNAKANAKRRAAEAATQGNQMVRA
jgi:hypothetical protein